MPNKLGDYPEVNYEEVPYGEWPVRVLDVDSCYSSAGKYGMKFTLGVLSEQLPNAKLWKYQYLEGGTPEKTDVMLGMFNGTLKKCGVPEEVRHALHVPIQSAQIKKLFIGKDFMVKKYKGKPDKTGKTFDQIDFTGRLCDKPYELLDVPYQESVEPQASEPTMDDVPF